MQRAGSETDARFKECLDATCGPADGLSAWQGRCAAPSAAQLFRPLFRGRGHRSAMSLPESSSCLETRSTAYSRLGFTGQLFAFDRPMQVISEEPGFGNKISIRAKKERPELCSGLS